MPESNGSINQTADPLAPISGITSNSSEEEKAEAVEAISNTMVEMAQVITRDIPLGEKGIGKTLISCEGGIKDFVKILAKDKTNDLPNTEVGVWIHYLTKGIERDFNKSWTHFPTAIKPRDKYDKKNAAESGVIKLTKAEKNDILEKLDWTYWEKLVDAGEFTREEAFAELSKVADRKKELEDQGYYLSPNKTEGVGLINPEQGILENWNGDWDALKVYKKKGLKVFCPNVLENFFLSNVKPRVGITSKFLKSILRSGALTVAVKYNYKGYCHKKGIVFDPQQPQYGGEKSTTISNESDLLDNIGFDYKSKNIVIKGIHLGVQARISKNPVIIVDFIDMDTQKRYLYSYSNDVVGKFEDDTE